MKCEKENHFKNIIYYKNILPNLNNVKSRIIYINGTINKFIEKIKIYELILNKILKNLKLFYSLYRQLSHC